LVRGARWSSRPQNKRVAPRGGTMSCGF
jgi:hypothetical protein